MVDAIATSSLDYSSLIDTSTDISQDDNYFDEIFEEYNKNTEKQEEIKEDNLNYRTTQLSADESLSVVDLFRENFMQNSSSSTNDDDDEEKTNANAADKVKKIIQNDSQIAQAFESVSELSQMICQSVSDGESDSLVDNFSLSVFDDSNNLTDSENSFSCTGFENLRANLILQNYEA